MATIGIRELRDNLSRVIQRVASGASIEVTDHGRVVARLLPPPTTTSAGAALDALIAAGVLISPDNPRPRAIAWPELSRPRTRRGLAATLIDEDRGE